MHTKYVVHDQVDYDEKLRLAIEQFRQWGWSKGAIDSWLQEVEELGESTKQ